MSSHPRLEAGICGLDVSVTVVDADNGDFPVVDHYIFHNGCPFLPFGRKKTASVIAGCLF